MRHKKWKLAAPHSFSRRESILNEDVCKKERKERKKTTQARQLQRIQKRGQIEKFGGGKNREEVRLDRLTGLLSNDETSHRSLHIISHRVVTTIA